MSRPIYLDYNATTPVHPEVLEAMLPWLRDFFGNPSSNHAYGFRLRAAVEEGRAKLAAFLGAEPDEIVFTSGGSEANNLAIKGSAFALRGRGDHFITTAVEHPAVGNALLFLERLGFRVTMLAVDEYGLVSPDAVAAAITERTILISVIHGQNEIGTLQPIREIAEIAHARGVSVHTDAAQTVGKIPVDVRELGVDLMTIAGNKFYGPKGAGALFVRRGMKLEPLIHGGGHERGLRAGTENAAHAVALGKTAEVAARRLGCYRDPVRTLRDRLEARLRNAIPAVVRNGHAERRLPNTLNLSFPGVDSSELLTRIRDRVACSTGSSCHAGRSLPSATLVAIGRPPQLASAALRLTLGAETTEEEIEEAAACIADGYARLRGEEKTAKDKGD